MVDVNYLTVSYMALNFLASVGIINVNKLVFQQYAFKYSTLLTGIHFIFTFIGLLICNALGMFTVKLVPIRKVIPLCLAFVGFVVFNNLSLQYNSIGFYQLMKVLTTPAIVIIQYVAYSVQVHPKLIAALVPVCIGVALATSSDVEMNFWGTFHALMGIVTTSFYQIWVKKEQQDLGLDSYQLLFLQSLPSAVMVFLLSLYFEPVSGPGGWMEYEYTIPSLTAILGSSSLAFLVNLSIFLVIGKTSPVAYNVLGHFKLCVILLSGFLFFHEDANMWKIIGTLLTLAGVIAYTHLQQNLKSGWEGREKAAQQAQQAGGPLVVGSGDGKVVGLGDRDGDAERERLINGNGNTTDSDLESQPKS